MEKTTIRISLPQSPHQWQEVRRVLHHREPRHQKDCLLVDLFPFEEPYLKILELNQLPGIRASLHGEFLPKTMAAHQANQSAR